MKRLSWLLPLVLVAAGCTASQALSIRTDPVGANVYLQRRGEVEIKASYAGVGGRVGSVSFEEGFKSLGNSPVEYEFDLRSEELDVDGGYGGGQIVRHFEEGMIRIEMDGFHVEERLVRFTGGKIRLDIVLRPLRPE
jgi:hypothetical protein